MRKYKVVTIILILALVLCSCTSKNAIKDSKEYLAEFYQNLNNGNATACFYQLNKNSCDMINTKYNLEAENFLSARFEILGQVKNHEILEESFAKDGDVKVVDLKVNVEYEKATVDETVQITIKKDGQTSINIIEFGEDDIIKTSNEKYLNAVLSNDINSIKENISPYYYVRKTERNLEGMLKQATEIGGKLLDCKITDGKHIYEKSDDGAFVYEAMIQMNMENAPMMNKIKLYAQNGDIGVGYTVILPEKILLFLSQYQSLLNDENKDSLLALYSDNLWGDSEDTREVWWNRLLTYSEAYGSLQDFNVTNMGLDKISDADGNETEVLRLVVDMEYDKKTVKNTLVLLDGEEYKIYDQYFSDD